MKVFKKLLLLFIMLCVAFSAFAETHILIIKTVVKEVTPIFALQYTDGTPLKIVTNEVNPFWATAEYSPLTKATAIDTYTDIAEEVLEISFTAELVNRAKTTKAYTLEFADGVFNVKKNKVDSTVSPTITITTSTTITNPALTGNPIVTASFKGAPATPGTLITAKYTYPVDEDVDPGTYYANIKLIISAV